MATEGVRYVVDTFVWVEALRGTPLGQEGARRIQANRCATPTIVLAELADRYTRDAIPNLAEDLDSIEELTEIVVLDRAIAEEGGRLKVEMRKTSPDVPLADGIVYATAKRLDAQVLTGDPHFKGRPGVAYLERP